MTATTLVPSPRVLDATAPVESLPRVEVRDGQLVVAFPDTCRWTEADRAYFVDRLRADATESVRRARLAQAERLGLV